MKKGLLSTCLCVLTLLAWGFWPLLAQQGPSQWPGSFQPPGSAGTISPPQFGQTPSQASPQSQGTQSLQNPPTNVSQLNQRYCSWVAVNQMPSLPPSLESQAGPQVTPIQSPWPGTLDASKIEELRAFQLSKSQIGARQPPTGQGQARSDQNVSGSVNPGQVPSTPNLGLPPGQLFTIEPFSTIEAVFQAPIFPGEKPRELRQYGYSLFASPVSTFAPVEDVPVGPDYVLGPGDDLAIHIWGAMEGAITRTIDRTGQLILPSVGPVRVWGLTFSQADKLIREHLSHYYRGFQTSVTMGRLRTTRVYVVGEVCQPGSFTVSSLSTVTNALFAAGGPLKLGSLRKIELKRDHHTVGTLDLYDFLLKGDKTRDFRLQPGDTIFVPPIGPVAAIAGEIKRPAIYELAGPTRVSDLIEMAGGATPRSYLKRVQVIRTKPNAEREVIDLDLTELGANGDSPTNIGLRDGDLVRIPPTDPRIYNSVSLSGAVKHPGEYQLKEGMRLAQILRPESVLPEAFLDEVEVARLKDDLTTQVMQINLKKAWEGDGAQNITLRPLDQITVRSEYRSPWSITLQGEVKRPGVYTIHQGERLASVLKRAGGYTDKAYLKGAIFNRERVRRIEEEQLKNFVKLQEERLVAQAGRVDVVGVDKEEIAQNQQTLAAQRELLRLLASRVAVGRMVVHLDDPDRLEGSPDDITLEDGDKLVIPSKPSSISILGAVRNPTSVLHKEGEGVEYYLNRAGGVTKQADEREIYIAKADGSAITGFAKLRDVEPGDAVIVPPKEEERIRWLSVGRDWFTILGQTMISIAALASIL